MSESPYPRKPQTAPWSEAEELRAENNRLSELTVSLAAELKELRAEAERLRAQKDGAYAERNQCVALLAKMALALGWKAGVGLHPLEDKEWEADWRTLVFIELPTGQATWHFHDMQSWLLEGLPEVEWKWDGHDTPEKYRRMNSIIGVGLPAEVKSLREQVANWERKEVERASCCDFNEQRAKSWADLSEKIEECLRWMGHSEECTHHESGPDTCDCGSDKLRHEVIAAIRSLRRPVKGEER